MPTLYGERIMLREYRKEDLPQIREWVNNPKITRFLSDIFLFPHSLTSTEGFLTGMLDNQKNDRGGFVIADRRTEAYLGQIDFHRIDWKNRKAIFGLVIGREENLSQGYGREAIGLLLQFAFRSLGLNRVALEVKSSNPRAIACYQRCGFREEGRLREDFYEDGDYVDTINMGILRQEWEVGRAEKI